MLNEFHRIAICKKIHVAIGEPRKVPDVLMTDYNEARPNQVRYRFGKMPMQTFLDARAVARDKQIGYRFIARLEA